MMFTMFSLLSAACIIWGVYKALQATLDKDGHDATLMYLEGGLLVVMGVLLTVAANYLTR